MYIIESCAITESVVYRYHVLNLLQSNTAASNFKDLNCDHKWHGGLAIEMFACHAGAPGSISAGSPPTSPPLVVCTADPVCLECRLGLSCLRCRLLNFLYCLQTPRPAIAEGREIENLCFISEFESFSVS